MPRYLYHRWPSVYCRILIDSPLFFRRRLSWIVHGRLGRYYSYSWRGFSKAFRHIDFVLESSLWITRADVQRSQCVLLLLACCERIHDVSGILQVLLTSLPNMSEVFHPALSHLKFGSWRNLQQLCVQHYIFDTRLMIHCSSCNAFRMWEGLAYAHVVSIIPRSD